MKTLYQIHRHTALLTFAIIIGISTRAQIITTVAGNGTYGYFGDGGLATAAHLATPVGIIFDAAGNYYIADDDNARIRKVTPSGIITTIAGTGTPGFGGDGGMATAAVLHGPIDVVFDTAGNLFFADQNNNRIRKISTSGIITTVAGGGGIPPTGTPMPATNAQLFPAALVFDRAGNLYTADGLYNKILKITPSGMITSIAGSGIVGGFSGDGGPATAAQLANPPGLAFDAVGNLYIADNGNGCIRKIDTFGIISTCVGTGGTLGYGGDTGPATAALLNRPNYVVFDLTGNMYISDGENNRVRKVNTSGIITTFIGTGVGAFSGDGGLATAAEIFYPRGLRIGASGDFYLCDAANERIRKITFNNHAPLFIHGDSLSMILCENAAATSMDSLLAVGDLDTGQSGRWSLWLPPAHGTAAVAYTATTTGGTLIPAGISYTPATGYSGTDSLIVLVCDGFTYDTTTVHLTINNCILGVSPFQRSIEGITAWPNPNDGTFSLNLTADIDEDAQIVISNMVGEKIKEFTTSTNKQTEVRIGAPPGIYFLSASTNHKRYTAKIMIK